MQQTPKPPGSQDPFKQNGFKIVSRNILPVEEKSMKYIVANKITINYCALIKKI